MTIYNFRTTISHHFWVLKQNSASASGGGVVIVFNVTFKNISVILWWSVLFVEETGENHRPVASNWQTLTHKIVPSAPRHWAAFELTTVEVMNTVCTGNWKSHYHTITTTTAPFGCGINRLYGIYFWPYLSFPLFLVVT